MNKKANSNLFYFIFIKKELKKTFIDRLSISDTY